MQGFLNPNKILNHLKLNASMTAADFGCGAGGWTIPLAKKLTKGKVFGIVYGIDILEEPLSALESKVKLSKQENIKTKRADIEEERGSGLADNSVDVVLATNLFFQVKDKDAVFKEIVRVLRADGQVLVVDWLKSAPLGPKQGTVNPTGIKALAKKSGLRPKKEFKAGAYHFGFVFVKS